MKTFLTLVCGVLIVTGGCASGLRVAHVSPDAPAVDVRVDGHTVLTGVTFEAFSDYMKVSAGNHNVKVSPTGKTEPNVIDASVDLKDGRLYTVAATGLLGQNDIKPLVVTDHPAPIMSDKAMVRFVHASPDAPAVDVAVKGGPILFGNVAFRGVSDYKAVNPGTYDLEVCAAGTETVALAVPGVTLHKGMAYTIYAAGLIGNKTLKAIPVMDGMHGQKKPACK